MSDLHADIVALVVDKVAVPAREVTDDADIDRDLGCTGDDHHELMEAFAARFGVDMSAYRWYFHTEEEGQGGPGSWFFKPPNERVEHIPITIDVLLEAARTKSWPVVYPPHQLPARRWDLVVNLVFVVLVFGWAISSFVSC